MRAALPILSLALALAGCESYGGFTRGEQLAKPATEGEDRLWAESAEFDEYLQKSGQVVDDAAAGAYVAGVEQRLYPEFQGRLHIHLLREPVLNAFALPNGSIYVNLGLIEAMDNEAQLATVLAHESVHVLNRHSAKERQTAIAMNDVLLSLGIVGLPPLAALGTEIAAAGAISGYSRDKESEADTVGFQHLVAAGYDPHEAKQVFQHLLGEIDATDTHQPFFFADHPKLQTRIENFDVLTIRSGRNGGDVGEQRFRDALGALKLRALKDKLAGGRYAAAVYSLTRPGGAQAYGPQADYYLGEAYRGRGKKGDAAFAESAYQRALKAAPEFAPTYRALGQLRLKGGQQTEARSLFARYLQLAPAADDRAWVESYLKTL